jgi:hypothetical protein
VHPRTTTNGPNFWERQRTTVFGPTKVSKSAPSLSEEAIRANGDALRYFLKLETFVPHKDHPDIDLSERGSSGPVKSELWPRLFSSVKSRTPDLAGFFGYNSFIAQQFMRACEAIGIPLTPDVNTSKGTMGVTEVMAIPGPD